MQHTTLCFVRTKSFPLWKVNTTILTNQQCTALCEENEWYSHSIGQRWSSWNDDASRLEIQSAWSLTSSQRRFEGWKRPFLPFLRVSGREAFDGSPRSDAIRRCWKSDEREREVDGEWRGMGTQTLSSIVAEANDTSTMSYHVLPFCIELFYLGCRTELWLPPHETLLFKRWGRFFFYFEKLGPVEAMCQRVPTFLDVLVFIRITIFILLRGVRIVAFAEYLNICIVY